MARRRGQNEGSVYQRKDGRWVGQLNCGWQNGRRQRRFFYGVTATEVQEKLLRARLDQANGLPVQAERQTVAQFLEGWLEYSIKAAVRPPTFKQYKQHVRLYLTPDLGRYQLAKLTPQDVRAFLNRRLASGLSPRTVQLSLVTLGKALSQATRDGVIARNVARLVDGPSVIHRDRRTFNPEQAARFLRAIAGNRLEALYSVALTLGLRQGEALALRWSDIDFERRTVSVTHSLARIARGAKSKLELVEPKTEKSRRTLALPETSLRALRAHRTRQLQDRLAAGANWQDRSFVFATRIGTPCEARNIYRHFRALLKRAQLPPLRFHDLRHSSASLMLAQGIPLRSIQEILGHSSIAITANLYAQVGEQLKRDAADAMDAIISQ